MAGLLESLIEIMISVIAIILSILRVIKLFESGYKPTISEDVVPMATDRLRKFKKLLV